jgi:hypothetical protein
MITFEKGATRRRVPAKTSGARILCERHNVALSPIVRLGLKFFDDLSRVGSTFPSMPGPSCQIVTAVNGYDVERWLLKILLGLARGIWTETNESWHPPQWWLEVLFGDKALPHGVGLSCLSGPDELLTDDQRVGMEPLWLPNGIPGGLLVRIAGIRFSLLMTSGAERLGTYRPGAFRFTSKDGQQQQILILGWNQEHPFSVVDVDL